MEGFFAQIVQLAFRQVYLVCVFVVSIEILMVNLFDELLELFQGVQRWQNYIPYLYLNSRSTRIRAAPSARILVLRKI